MQVSKRGSSRSSVSRRRWMVRRCLLGPAIIVGVLAGAVGSLVGDAVGRSQASAVALARMRPLAVASPPAFMSEVLEAEVPGGLSSLEGTAVDDASGDVYQASLTHVIKLSPWGTFILSFGHGVNQTKVQLRQAEEASGEPVTVTEEEEDICTAASGDVCGAGSNVVGGILRNANGIAVEQASHDVYVVDSNNHRVDKFDASGQFLLAFGREVNRAKTEAVDAVVSGGGTPTEAELKAENLCAAGEECQAGKTGGGEGQFETWPSKGAFLAVGGPKEVVYVGDKARIQEFDSAGEQVAQVSTAVLSSTAKVQSLAVDPSGDIFFADEKVNGVHELEGGTTLNSTVFDAADAEITAVTLDESGHVFVADASPRWYQAPFKVLEYELAQPAETPVELAVSEPGKVEYYTSGLAVSPAGALYVANGRAHSLIIFGSAAAMESLYGEPPLIPPVVLSESSGATPGEGSATLSATVNTQLAKATYQFEYGLEPCSLGGCVAVPATPQPVGTQLKGPVVVSTTVEGLLLDRVYHWRLRDVESKAGSAEGSEQVLTVGGLPVAGAAGLDDGRIYRQVTPNNKYAHEPIAYGDAAADGESLLFVGGAMGNVDAGFEDLPLVSRHEAGSWATTTAMPPPLSGISPLNTPPVGVAASEGMTQFAFASGYGVYSPEEPPAERTGSVGFEHSVGIYETAEDPSESPFWLGRPTSENPVPAPGHGKGQYLLAGGSADLSHVFFSYTGTLVPEDGARAANVGSGGGSSTAPWGFYEWSRSGAGQLRSAGVLPDGTVSAWGAIPAAIAGDSDNARGRNNVEAVEPVNTGNQVVDGGREALFVSPDPLASTVTNALECASASCTSEAPQLYLRRVAGDGSAHSTLVSASHLSGHEGEPAPDGALGVGSAAIAHNVQKAGEGGSLDIGYGYASTDGNRVFFESVDRLTEDASEDGEAKEYVYEAATGGLTYIPGIAGPVVAAAADGSPALIENRAATPAVLDLWSAEGGITEVAQLPQPEVAPPYLGTLNLEARATSDGSVFAFDTNAPVPAGFNNGGGYSEVYRYETAAESLSCLSCPGNGQAPTGNAEITHDDVGGQSGLALLGADTRAMSADGSRVFFDTPASLVPGDQNGVRDVYEWEAGKLSLVSSGTSPRPSYYIDSSAGGGDVFFSTSAGLSASDVDEGYDVYDARVPRPGETPPATTSCEGAACHPARLAEALSAPASELFDGLGNLAGPSPKHNAKRRSKAAAKRLRHCRSHARRHRRRGRRRRALRRCVRRFGRAARRHPRGHRQARSSAHRGQGRGK